MRLRWAVLFALLGGCNESLPPASAVTDFRVVAARVDIEEEAGRANPNPGEAMQASLLVIDQGAPASGSSGDAALTPAPLQWVLVACLPLPTTIGPPLCRTPIEPCEGCDETPPDDPLATPVVRFSAPSESELEEAEASSLLLQGVVCGNGAPSQEALLAFLMGETEELEPCEGPPTIEGQSVEGRVVAVQIPIERNAGDPNLNPELLDVLLNGQPWPPPYDRSVPRETPRTGCVSDLEDLSEAERSAHPRAGSPPSAIDLSVTRESLQTYVEADQTITEEIQVSWLADGGSYESSFSFITDPARSVLTRWQPFPEAADDGVLVRFNFVIRDGRGGTDWFERGLCVLPPDDEQTPP